MQYKQIKKLYNFISNNNVDNFGTKLIIEYFKNNSDRLSNFRSTCEISVHEILKLLPDYQLYLNNVYEGEFSFSRIGFFSDRS